MVQRYFSARLSRAQRTNAPSSAGGAWPVRVQKAASRAGMSPGARNDGVVGIDQRGERPGGLGAGDQLLVRAVAPGAGPGPAALLHQPEPHDVLEQPRRARDAPLVREVVPQRLGGDHRPGDLDPQQRPRPRAEVAPVGRPVTAADARGRPPARRPRRWPCRGSPAPGRSAPAASPTSSATDRRSGPSSVPGSISSGRIAPGQVEPAAERVGPGPGPRVEQLRRRGVGPLADPAAGQEPGEQVGHHQERLGRPPAAASPPAAAPGAGRAVLNGRNCRPVIS